MSLDLARKWIHDCFNNHPSCQKPAPGFMPTRVLDISSPNQVVFIRDHVTPAPYAVLSYCWGGSQRITLTTSRVWSGDRAIPEKTLPATLLDAVLVSREMGLRYLWIDSLCIVQDDVDDMATEIGRMGHIYENSYVAIMASRAGAAEEGFLQPRYPFGVSSSSPGFRLPYIGKDGSTGFVTAIDEEESIAYMNPLRSRGWAYQELFLSQRILDFGQMGTTWICQDEQNHTDGFSSPLTSIWSRSAFKKLLSLGPEKASHLSKASGYEHVSDPRRIWSAMVQQYMKATLTFPHDILPAIAGLAERVRGAFRDEYVAGTWKGVLWACLVWYNEDGRHWKRRAGYFAPSWSWASIPNGKIGYISTNSSFADEEFEVLEFQAEPVSEAAPYGAVKCGHVAVRGRGFTASYKTQHPSHTLDADIIHLDDLENTIVDPGVFSIFPDTMLEEPLDQGSMLWFLCVSWDYKRNKMSGLCLRQLEDGKYCRVGLFSIYGNLKMDMLGDAAKGLREWDLPSQARAALYKQWRAGLSKREITII